MTPRRVVTGLDADGRSTILFDDRVAGDGSTLMWRTETTPADNGGAEDRGIAASGRGMPKLHDGSRFVLARFTPGDGLYGPGMHATDTLDYIALLDGRIELLVETGSVMLEAGDIIVDRGVVHGWRVLGDTPVTMAVVILPAHPVGAGATI